MKNFLKILILLLPFFLFGNLLNAQLHDVYSGKYLEISHRVIDFTARIKFAKGDMDFDCLHIDNEPTPKTALVNAKVLELYKSYLLNEANFLPVYRKMEKRIDQYNKFINSFNNGRYRDNSVDKLAAKLQYVNSTELSYVSNLLFFSMDFQFWIQTGSSYEGIEFVVSEYYHVDLTTAEITKLEFEWSEAQKEKIISKIKDELNEDRDLITSTISHEDMDDMLDDGEDDYDDEDGEEIKTETKPHLMKDVSSLLKIEEADFYWLGWGLVVNFQQFTESSGIYSGNPFEIYIPLEKAKKIMENVPQFSFVTKLKEPVNNQKDFNYMEFSKQAIDIHDPRDITDWVREYDGESHPKSVMVTYYQIMQDSSRHNLSKTKYDFTKNGKILKSYSYGLDEKVILQSENTYNEKGKLLLKAKFDRNGSTGETEKYSYDEKGNLIQILFTTGDDFYVYRYFYNGNYVYEMVRYFFRESHSNRISKNYYDGKELRYGDQTYLLNEKGKMIGVKSEKYISYQMQLARNENGQLIEVHRENDRYNRFFQYDSLGRLDAITNFENSRLQISNQFRYEGTFAFPQKMESLNTSGGHNLRQVYEYLWEFY